MRSFNMPPLTPPPRSVGKAAALSLASMLLATTLAAQPVLVEKFEGTAMRPIDAAGGYWSVKSSPRDSLNSALQGKGRLQILAEDHAYAHVSLTSPKTDKFGFFARPITVTLEDIHLRAAGIPEGEARFKLSLASARTTAELAPSVVCLRVRSGLLLMGYRADGFNLASPPETLAGDRINSVAVMPLKGVPSKVELTLGPASRDGYIRYEIVARDDDTLVTRSGTIALTLDQWGGANEAALVLDVRRDSESSLPGTYTEFSAGQLTLSR